MAALRKASAAGLKLQNIRSVGGFVRRLNDITCAGCHQTRGIGGFHFSGVDWMAASHRIRPWCRRRRISSAIRFAAVIFFRAAPGPAAGLFTRRPAARSNAESRKSPVPNIAMAVARYARGKLPDGDDSSFRNWTCAEGLVCQAVGKAAHGHVLRQRPLGSDVLIDSSRTDVFWLHG